MASSSTNQDTDKHHISDGANDATRISRKQLDKLTRETRMLKSMVTNLMTQDVQPAHQALIDTEKELVALDQAVQTAVDDRDHWKAQYGNALDMAEREKQDRFGAVSELQTVRAQLAQQTEYSACMGAACCTLLWRVARCEDAIPSLLAGTKVDSFLVLAAGTLTSYLHTYGAEPPPDQSPEAEFIVAVCGFLTNIAASPFGRDFLMTSEHARALMDVCLEILAKAPTNKCAKMKNLIIMALYNVSINQKGLKYLSGQPEIVEMVVNLVNEERGSELRVHALRLLQSLVCEPPSEDLRRQVAAQLTSAVLQQWTADAHTDVRQVAHELQADLRELNGCDLKT